MTTPIDTLKTWATGVDPSFPPPPARIEFSSYYLGRVREPKSVLVDFKYETKGIDFDTLVGTGLSGSLIIPVLADHLDLNFLIVRKPGVVSHGNHMEGRLGRRWLFVDDMVASGKTFVRVRDTVATAAEQRGFATEFVGGFLYNTSTYRNAEYANLHWSNGDE